MGYITLGYLIYLYIVNYQNLEIDIKYESYFKYFWNLPFYFISEILYWILIYFDNKKNKELTDFEKENSKKYVNVVIAAHNAEETLKSNLSNITSKFPNYKVWVADNDNNSEENISLKDFCEEN